MPLRAWFQAIDLLLREEEVTVSGLARAVEVDRKTGRTIKEKLLPLRQNPFIRSIRASILSWKIQNLMGKEESAALKKDVAQRSQTGNLS